MQSIGEHRDLVFRKLERRRLRLDLAVPSTPGPHPVVIVVHGGSWRRGGRGNARGIVRSFAAHGYAAAGVTYRLARAPRNVFPMPIADLRCAVRWLRLNAASYDLDPDRFAAVGFSAGAHLASLLGTATENSALDGDCPWAHDASPAVQAVVALYGAYDLREGQIAGPGVDGTIRNFLGTTPEEDPELAAVASPITHIDRTDPPFLLFHGLHDSIVDPVQSRRMSAALEAAHVPRIYVEFPNEAHGFSLFPPDEHNEVAGCTTLQFLEDTIREASH